MFKVGHRRGSERVELFFRLVGGALVLIHRVPSLGQDLLPLALAKGDCHLLPPLDRVCHLGGHEGLCLSLLDSSDCKYTGGSSLGWLLRR